MNADTDDPAAPAATPAVRAADRDREATLQLLSIAVSDGRPTLEEYSAR